jgi:hypothetical protein
MTLRRRKTFHFPPGHFFSDPDPRLIFEFSKKVSLKVDFG